MAEEQNLHVADGLYINLNALSDDQYVKALRIGLFAMHADNALPEEAYKKFKRKHGLKLVEKEK